MELSLLPGQPVFSPLGETLGYVKCAYVCKNMKNLSCLVCVDGEEEEFILPARELRFGNGGVTAGKARMKAPSGVPCPVGKAVFDRAGRFLGHCSGMDPDRGTLSAGKAVFPLSRAAAGDVVFVSSSAAKGEKKATCCANNQTQVAKINNLCPFGTDGDGEFGVLGKQVKKPVEGVADRGETVTAATLKRARENNKLLELAANTLTG